MKIFASLFLALLMFSICIPTLSENVDTNADIAENAVIILKQYWKEIIYEEGEFTDYTDHLGYLEIKNTRIFKIFSEPTIPSDASFNEAAEMYFGDIAYVVEFMLIEDYCGMEPYYYSSRMASHVIIYEDGTCKVNMNPFDKFRGTQYITDMSGIIEEIIDFDDTYNAVYHLLKE